MMVTKKRKRPPALSDEDLKRLGYRKIARNPKRRTKKVRVRKNRSKAKRAPRVVIVKRNRRTRRGVVYPVRYIIKASVIGGGKKYYNADRGGFDTPPSYATRFTSLQRAKQEANRIQNALPFKILSIGVHKV